MGGLFFRAPGVVRRIIKMHIIPILQNGSVNNPAAKTRLGQSGDVDDTAKAVFHVDNFKE